MVDKNKNKGEFDEGFDDDFSDTNFDDISFEDTSFDDATDEDAEYESDDFESEEWGEGEEDPKAAGKKPKKQKSGGGGGLSFNAIVIIGAVVLGGGVLAFNIMRETNKAASAKPSAFQSILSLSGVMDGLLSGDKEETATTEEKPQDQSQGFLNDPNMPIPATPQDNVPPQPAPIAPVDGAATNEPLTPLPPMTGEPSAEAPRGPDDLPLAETTPPMDSATALPPVAEVPVTETPATPESASSAEDILKKAMANREQKQQEESTDAQPSNTEALKETLEEKVADAKEKTEEVVADVKEDVKDIVTPDPVPLTEEITPEPTPVASVVDPLAPVPTEAAAPVNNAEVAALSAKLDTLLKRMDQIEGDLETVRESKAPDTQDLEKTVASLKKDIAAIKDRPASAVRESVDEVADVEETPKPAPVKKKKAPKPVMVEDEAYSPSAPVAAAPAPKATPAPVKAQASAAPTGRWELRAAQPGRAWVSKPGERDMQAVAVGENLAGVGRITGITYQNGRWTVSGTQGSIQQ